MKRISIIGISGAGKSTLTRELSERLGLPIISLDKEYWQPGWQKHDSAKWDVKLAKLVARDRWIMDGNYSSHFLPRFKRTNMLVYLDFPRYLAMYRVIKRIVFGYGQVRPESAEGCPERFDWEFLKYVWHFRARYRPRAEKALEGYDPAQLHRLCSPKEVTTFLEKFPAPTQAKKVAN